MKKENFNESIMETSENKPKSLGLYKVFIIFTLYYIRYICNCYSILENTYKYFVMNVKIFIQPTQKFG